MHVGLYVTPSLEGVLAGAATCALHVVGLVCNLAPAVCCLHPLPTPTPRKEGAMTLLTVGADTMARVLPAISPVGAPPLEHF